MRSGENWLQLKTKPCLARPNHDTSIQGVFNEVNQYDDALNSWFTKATAGTARVGIGSFSLNMQCCRKVVMKFSQFFAKFPQKFSQSRKQLEKRSKMQLKVFNKLFQPFTVCEG